MVDQRSGALPTFLIIGAAKCGTTSLHRYLDLHPEIGMSRVKEPHFFAGRDAWTRGVDWYRTLFDPAFLHRGESSVGYTTHPQTTGVPERIASVIPDVKLIYLIRDPVIRLMSEWVHGVADGIQAKSLDEAVSEMAGTRFGDRGRYFHQIQQYHLCFPPARLMVVTSERMRRDRRATLSAIFRFLGVSPDYWSTGFDRVLHESRFLRRKNAIGRLLRRVGNSRAAARVPAHRRHRIGRILYRPFSHPIERPTLGPAAAAFAREYYREDVAALRDLLRDPLSEWSI